MKGIRVIMKHTEEALHSYIGNLILSYQAHLILKGKYGETEYK
jgi:hypothetical protein